MRPAILGKEKKRLIMIKRSYSKKSAAIPKSVVFLLVALVVLLLFVVFYSQFFAKLGATTEKQICKASVYTQFATKLKNKVLGADIFNTEIECPIRMITIDKKENDNAKQIVAKAMYDCWDQFGEGKLALFEDEKVYCSACNHITFEDKNLKITDFGEYLASTKIGTYDITYSNGIPTYMEYLTGYQTKGYEFIEKKKQGEIVDSGIDTSQNNEYAIMFVYAKGRDKIQNFMHQATGALRGSAIIAGSVLIGAAGVKTMAVPLVGKPIGFTIISGALAVGGYGVYDIIKSWRGIDYEWGSFVVLREYNKETIDQLGCENMPAAQT